MPGTSGCSGTIRSGNARFSNGWDSSESEPWDVARLGDFTARLLHELRLDDAAGRAPAYLEAASASDGAVRWRWRVPQSGRYEIALWHDADPGNTHDARATLAARGQRKEMASLDLSTWGRRWIRVGDVELQRGMAELALTSAASGRLPGGRLRIARWPDAQVD